MEESELYQAATNSLASDASSENCYSKMANETNGYCGDYKSFEKDLKSIEVRIKSEYKITSMPSAWRSAKSVLVKCMKGGIAIFNSNDTLKGKTELQNELKTSNPTPLSILDSCKKHLKNADKLYQCLDSSGKLLVIDFYKELFRTK